MTSTILLHLLVFVLIIANIICCWEKRRPPLSGSCHKFHPCSPPLQTKNKPLVIISYNRFCLFCSCFADEIYLNSFIPTLPSHSKTSTQLERLGKHVSYTRLRHPDERSESAGHRPGDILSLIIDSHLNSSASSLTRLPLVCNELLPGPLPRPQSLVAWETRTEVDLL